ncbi:hypothetical protein A2130_00745 [Candidatus Woesebacteria bacterium GWC2_33_12]|uniref:Uncharacterized protein n=1 Tax=Candidatus Woesebacteria bacterium GW2011_GWB1_33_22 TaxID=1618566 RepID=A0A0G0CPE7_9BACT|nr:MAG: hypothetical protein UR29_C0002G0042 [Candidatus Woesebacteria bacterium GW2011_GWC2_33_12]KKP42514.1 MAG: hypothetical protein UR33_C0002G0090 [Candidatus Woesebacteria bacterium GW2011_GWA2_33_20]KKP45257.1 MAG: hypothetical protein UR35_C0002G0090 [Candidatus Woesebacteria bacterium GW2011_GWB1_33_22]KKP46448.1 MAG: hypothetical protein UR37_C0007G0005 [Microgenomates group bacterium GW2011_GWC1_33_28]KKP50927.1 MAG: hypothetical protein UR41_C0002G0091 [Candidatus Woesebacteria bact
MTERVLLSLKRQIDDLLENSLGSKFKSFGLNTHMVQVNQAQMVGIFRPEEGLTPDEANKLRKYILDSNEKLKV